MLPIRAQFALIAAFVLALPAGCATSNRVPSAGDLVTESRVTGPGERALVQSIVVPAPAAEVWRAWTTSEGFSAWAAPVARVDLRLGGIIESSYDARRPIGDPANIRNEVLAFVPERMLAIRNVQSPPGVPFDIATFQSLQTVLLLEPASEGATKVTAWQLGYREGAAYEGVWNFFERGNAATLVALRKHFERTR